MRRIPFLLIVLFVGLGAGCLSQASVQTVEPPEPVTAPDAFDHSDFSAVLRDVVDERGYVDYAAFAHRNSLPRAALDAYLGRLAATDPSNLSNDDRLAFLLNAYNAYTLKLIVDNYPVESIRDVVGGAFVPLVNTPFKVEFVTIGGEVTTLDDVEHGTIRKEFDEPRIHFALVCAALSCPPLRDEAYTGDRLDQQLDEQARRFLSNDAKNRVPLDDDAIGLSKIFSWFKSDFGGNDRALQVFLAPYFHGDVRSKLEQSAYDVDFLPYDWSLNDTSSIDTLTTP
jgi:hypothetical protein